MFFNTTSERPAAYVRELKVEEIPNLMHQPYEPYYGARPADDPYGLIDWGYDMALVMMRTAWKGFEVFSAH
ncbi:MAG: hypothetical protein KC877_03780 [Candidatus Kaiserbacteria bacterium]|nr:hypothetical protein [Candidatus Kaiserbacteria bacterium]MCB9816858.1 hypothetical protein [Candidatus Nomurabacteria bacterium]